MVYFKISWTRNAASVDMFAYWLIWTKRYLAHSDVTVKEADMFVFQGKDKTREDFVAINWQQNYCSCRTDMLPYTSDVMMACILMVEYGLAKDLDASDNKEWLAVLDQVHAKHPLKSYDEQREHFTTQIAADEVHVATFAKELEDYFTEHDAKMTEVA